jgi:hypothetical protein
MDESYMGFQIRLWLTMTVVPDDLQDYQIDI